MKIFFEQKKPGRLKQSIKTLALDINVEESTVGGLIAGTVRACVDIYNNSISQAPEDFDCDTSHSVKSEEEIADLAETGRVAFGIVFEGKPVNTIEAINNAKQCYEDGLFRVFLNGKPLGNAEDIIEIKDGDTLTVVRLTMLAGRMW